MKRHAAKTAAGAAVLIIALLSLVVIAAEYAAPPIKLVPAEETLKRAKGNLPKMIQTEDSAKASKISKMLQTVKYESFDFHPVVDGMKLTRHPKRESGGEWYGNVEGVDTTCALLIGERALVEIARGTGPRRHRAVPGGDHRPLRRPGRLSDDPHSRGGPGTQTKDRQARTELSRGRFR
jgi:hypothetical protein